MALGLAAGLPWTRISSDSAWAPGDATGANLVQWCYDVVGDTDASPWIKDKSQTGDERILSGGPGLQQGQCLSFDGTNDYVSLPIDANTITSSFSVFARFNKTNAATDNDRIFDIAVDANNYFQLTGDNANQTWAARLVIGGVDKVHKFYDAFDFGVDHNIVCTWDGATFNFYHDGVLTSGTGSPSIGYGAAGASIGRRNDGNSTTFFQGKLWDCVIWSTDLSAAQRTSVLANEIVSTSLVAGYHLDEQSGSTAYDYSGNEDHGTIYGATYTTQDVNSWHNDHGYYLNGSVFVPRDESDTANDVLGNTLTYTGSGPRHGRFESNHCMTGDGIARYGTVGWTPTSDGAMECLFYYNGTNSDIFMGCNDATQRCYLGVTSGGKLGAGIASHSWATIVGTTSLVSGTWYRGKVTWDGVTVELFLAEWDQDYGAAEYSAAQSGSMPTSTAIFLGALNSNATPTNYWASQMCDAKVSESGSVVHRWPLAEGSGSGSYDVIGNDDVTWNTVDWGTTQNVFAYNANYGFTLSSGIYIPANQDKVLDAAGNAIGNPAVDGNNRGESTIEWNPFDIPALKSGNLNNYTLEEYYAVDCALPKPDQHFCLREDQDKDESEFILYDTELTGDDWDNIHTYVKTLAQLNARLIHVWPNNALTADTPPESVDEVGSTNLTDSDDEFLLTESGKLSNAMRATSNGASYMDQDALDCAASASLDLGNPISHYGWIKVYQLDGGGDDVILMDQGSNHTFICPSTGAYEDLGSWTYNGTTIRMSSEFDTSWNFYALCRDDAGNITLWLNGTPENQARGITVPSGTGSGIILHFRELYDSDIAYDEHGITGTNKLCDNHIGWLYNQGTGKAINTTSNEYE